MERKHARCLYDPVQHTHSRSWLTMPADGLGVAAPIITLGLRDVIGMSQSRIGRQWSRYVHCFDTKINNQSLDKAAGGLAR